MSNRVQAGLLIRRDWLMGVVRELQKAATSVGILDPPELQSFLTALTNALPPPTNPAEDFALRGLLLEFSLRLGTSLHDRAHQDRGRPTCPFIPERTVVVFLQSRHEQPCDAFGRWLDSFFDALNRIHRFPLPSRAARILRMEYQASWDLAQLAQRLGVSTTQLRCAFEREYGVSVHTYHKTIRVINALDQMHANKVEVVAREVGYKGKKSLYRAIRTLTGLTPTQFRLLSGDRARRVVETLSASLSKNA